MGETNKETHRHTIHTTPLGSIYLATDGEALTGAWLSGQAHYGTEQELGYRIEAQESPVLSQAVAELDRYFANKLKEFQVPINPAGSDFQLAVWQVLRDIPYGYTTTYGAISKIVGPHAPARAVGQAVGRNKCLIFIPCHRVIAADGKITGYAAGIERKQFLLNLESPESAQDYRLF